MTGIEIWFLFVVIPGLGYIGVLGVCISSAALIIGSLFLIDRAMNYNPKSCKGYIKYCLISVGVLLISICLTAFSPNKKEMAAIIFGPTVLQNEEVQKLPENLIKYINSLIEVGEDK